MKTYFFEKENGEVFACEAVEGDQVMRDVNRRTKLIGVSDGKKYAEIMKAWKPKHSEVEEEELAFQAEYKSLQDQAFAEELKIARRHIEYPPDLSVSGDKDAVQFVKKNGR